ncbi:DUF1491 family protein [Sphingomonas colocasiae]|nr:DUF1491 family protein [Sphingomonas colocasiae]
MTPRLSSAMLVGALIRRVQAEGGYATVLAKGDAGGGAIIIACAEKGRVSGLFERILDMGGAYIWAPCGPRDSTDPFEISQYLERRRTCDPDIWIVELDIADAERFAAETIGPA